jgi:hypothetical protein
VTWQAALALCLYVGWVALHSWLGKKRHLKTLALLIALEVLGFVGFFVWSATQDYDVSAGGAVAIALFAAAAFLLIPAGVGTYSMWKYRTTRDL